MLVCAVSFLILHDHACPNDGSQGFPHTPLSGHEMFTEEEAMEVEPPRTNQRKIELKTTRFHASEIDKPFHCRP
jgi:hypothetical protein